MPPSPAYRPARRHETLGEAFFDAVRPARFPDLTLRHRDQRWAAAIGLDTLTDAEWLAHMGRFEPLPDNMPEPLALRYHGHQFRSYNPDLGDGRGFLYAQMFDRDGRLLDLGTKGSGQTPWSRAGDGRLTLKGGVREVLATEMLEALGVDTSKSLSLIETGEALERHDEPSPTRGAVLVRLSHSHIRIGSFQRLAYLGDTESLGRLLDYSIETYVPEAAAGPETERAVRFLDIVTARCARLAAQWMVAGFVHGVLNTDNINITGESFDYGPWRFAPTYDPPFTAAYFDHGGLYAFGCQPETLLWNLTRLAECLLPLSEKERLVAVLQTYADRFRTAYDRALLWRLGLASRGPEADSAFAAAWWTGLLDSGAPFERAFFDAYARPLAGHEPIATRDHPYWSRPAPVTLLIDEVEALWAPIAEADDWSAFRAKLADIAELRDAYAAPVADSARP